MCCPIPAPASSPASRRSSTAAEGVIEAEFAARVHEPLAEPGTCGVGYNSLRFDDEFTRHLLYRNFYDPYAREWENGNSRWDLIDLARMCYALRPHGIEWPRREDDTPSFRLEDLARANHVVQRRAHDALSDVEALLGFARVLRYAPAAPVGLASRAAPQAARVRAARRRQHDAAAARVVALSGRRAAASRSSRRSRAIRRGRTT